MMFVTDQQRKTLRYYQADAVEAVKAALQDKDSRPLVVLPTGAGKTLTMVSIIEALNVPTLVLAHVGELVLQTHRELEDHGIAAAIYSAGLGERHVARVTVGTIQTVTKRPERFKGIKLVLVDEAHRIPPEGTGQYRSLLAALPGARLVGMTATPYRTTTGRIVGKNQPFSEVCISVGVKKLTDEGYLSPIRFKLPPGAISTAGVKIQSGEFSPKELESNAMDAVEEGADALVRAAKRHGRKSVLIFASGVEHAIALGETLRIDGPTAVVVASTPSEARDRAVHKFRNGDLQFLVNCAVFTEGFDAPNVDMVVLARPTMSPGLFYQMTGRGLRKAGGKPDCIVVDLGGNLIRHGHIESLEESKAKPPIWRCEKCYEAVVGVGGTCLGCKSALPEKPFWAGGNRAVLLEALEDGGTGIRWDDCRKIEAYQHNGPSGVPTLRLEFKIGWQYGHKAWLCVGHPRGSYAWRKASEFWGLLKFRDGVERPCPRSVEEGLWLADAIKPPLKVGTMREGQYTRVVGVEYESEEERERL